MLLLGAWAPCHTQGLPIRHSAVKTTPPTVCAFNHRYSDPYYASQQQQQPQQQPEAIPSGAGMYNGSYATGAAPAGAQQQQPFGGAAYGVQQQPGPPGQYPQQPYVEPDYAVPPPDSAAGYGAAYPYYNSSAAASSGSPPSEYVFPAEAGPPAAPAAPAAGAAQRRPRGMDTEDWD